MTWFRAYDSEVGRWLSPDPIGEEGGLNLYGYVENDPVNFRDLDGLRPWHHVVPFALGLDNGLSPEFINGMANGMNMDKGLHKALHGKGSPWMDEWERHFKKHGGCEKAAEKKAKAMLKDPKYAKYFKGATAATKNYGNSRMLGRYLAGIGSSKFRASIEAGIRAGKYKNTARVRAIAIAMKKNGKSLGAFAQKLDRFATKSNIIGIAAESALRDALGYGHYSADTGCQHIH